MFFKYFLCAGLATVASSASIYERDDGPVESICGTPHPTDEQLEYINNSTARALEGGLSRRQNDDEQIEIQTIVHVVAVANSREGGMLSEESVNKAIKITNDLYASAKISFKIQDITYTVDPRLAHYGNDQGMAMKQRLRRGDSSVLNLYYVRSFSQPGLLGICTFPTRPGQGYVWDGCAVASHSVPGGPPMQLQDGRYFDNPRREDPSDYGVTKVTAHEIGHWLNLQHTFPGDGTCRQTADLPPESGPSGGCRPGQNRCGASWDDELKLNTNIMSYASCGTQDFTAGQVGIMRDAWWRQRKTDGNGNGNRNRPSPWTRWWRRDEGEAAKPEPQVDAADVYKDGGVGPEEWEKGLVF